MESLRLWARILLSAAVTCWMLPDSLHGQCNLVLTSASVQEDCNNYSQPLAYAAWTGGTPPFTVSVAGNSGLLAQAATGDSFWFSELVVPPGTQQATITVADELGCVASTVVFWTDHIPMVPVVAFTLDCIVGPTLRWSGLFDSEFGASVPSGCPGPFNYQLSNTSTGQIWNGSVAADWVAESPSGWHFGQALPAGNYVVDIFKQSGLSCNATFNVECFRPANVQIPGTTSDCGVNFNLRAALAGALPSGTLMGDQLRVAGLIPTSEPYSGLGYSYVGAAPGAALTPSLLAVTGNNAVVDWVVVELRSATNPASVVYSRSALIQRDGDVVGLNGSTYINAPVAAGNYHVALKHRNHLGIMTGSSRNLLWDQTATTIDFRLSGTATYGTGARTAVGSVQCLWPGDATGNGEVKYVGANNDRDPILFAIGGSTPTNVVSGVYSPLDVNMDGVIKYVGNGNDRDPILTTVGGSTPTYVRTQQLP